MYHIVSAMRMPSTIKFDFDYFRLANMPIRISLIIPSFSVNVVIAFGYFHFLMFKQIQFSKSKLDGGKVIEAVVRYRSK